MKRLIKGEFVLASQTVRIDKRTVLAKNRSYMVKGAKWSCCRQVVDIGYMHPTPIVRSCASCGTKTQKASRRVWIPSSYFRRRGEKIDRLNEQVHGLQKLFSKLS